MKRTLRTILAVAALCAAQVPRLAYAAPPAPECEPVAPAWAQMVLPGSLLLLGEFHGTVQSPALAARFVCAALRRRHGVTLFLEIPSDEQARIDVYLRSDGGLAAQRALIGGSGFWQAPIEAQDGRRSVAMLGLIDTVRRWQRSGAPLHLIAFDAARDADRRDREMADRVRLERARDPLRVLITYTGNVHGMLELPPGMPAGIAAPMGSYLADLRPVSLDLRPVAGGATWNCQVTCGVQPARPLPLSQLREMRRDLRRSFTDVVPLGAITPSIPAAFRLDARRDVG